MYQDLYFKAKYIIKEDAYMKFYDELKALYQETDSSDIIQVQPFIGMGWYVVWVWQSSRQHSIAPHCICKQKLIKNGAMV